MTPTIDTSASSQTSTVQEAYLDPCLLEQYLPLVKKVVLGLARHLPSQVDVDDLQSVGTIGLISAVRRYDADQEKTFEAYATLRIRGAVLDELRRLDSLPRTARARARQLQETNNRLEQSLGREPSDTEVSEALGVDMGELRRIRLQARPVSFLSLDNRQNHNSDDNEADLHEAIPDDTQALGSDQCQQQELVDLLNDRIRLLPDRQRRVLAMIYFENMRLSEIAEVFGVTEARICQIRSQAIAGLRRHMQSFIEE